MSGRAGWSVTGRTYAPSTNSQTPSEPAFRAPWGELEREIPYVTITTQLFPLEWWTPPAMRAAAVTRATAHPAELVARLIPVFEPILHAPDTAPAVEAATALEPEPQPAIMQAAIQRAPEPPAIVAPRNAPSPKRRAAQARRGLVARLVIVAVGLVISLIAVETATRRRV